MSATSGAFERGRGASGALPELVPGLRWRRVVPGHERQLRVLRRWLESLLPQCPARDHLTAVTNELASNAVRHTASGRGGWLSVEIVWYGPVVRVAVADSGAAATPRVIEDLASETGRGLRLVRGMSVRTGVCGDHRGRLIWADVRWADTTDTTGTTTATVMSPDPYEVAIRDGEAALARSFAGIPTWFGRSTLQWWAMVGTGGLVTAPSARELGGLLDQLLHAPPQQRPPATAQAPPFPAEERDARRYRGPGASGGTLHLAAFGQGRVALATA